MNKINYVTSSIDINGVTSIENSQEANNSEFTEKLNEKRNKRKINNKYNLNLIDISKYNFFQMLQNNIIMEEKVMKDMDNPMTILIMASMLKARKLNDNEI
ncbi:hypothetical protein [Clostridium hydrogenum]|uniref:hypothetical protein n=1 Tax=Clostridium hydrogenum TaxID=2855764 RepID=UPI001F43EDD3|nr:hypothetical protein [Clostridium hydrogenum]